MISGSALVVAAHPDDEVLGVGGTIARFAACGSPVHIAIATTAAILPTEAAARLAHERHKDMTDVQAVFGPMVKYYAGGENELSIRVPQFADWLVRRIETLRPRYVFTHSAHDLHQDHRAVAEATQIACRPYQSPSVEAVYAYIVDPFEISGRRHTVFSVLSDDDFETKLAAMQAYETELRPSPHPRSLDAIDRRAKHFGAIVGRNYAEPLEAVWSLL